MTTIQSLLQNHDQIQRVYNNTDEGIQSVTTSTNPQVCSRQPFRVIYRGWPVFLLEPCLKHTLFCGYFRSRAG